MTRRHLEAVVVAMLAGGAVAPGSIGCGGSTAQQQHRVQAGPGATPMPDWVAGGGPAGDTLCGMGVAGAGFDADSPYPKELSRSRALSNLAGILGTQVQEAIIDNQESNGGNDVQLARVLHVDDALLDQVGQVAKTAYWLDADGSGPYGQKGFTYANACMSAEDAQGAFKLDPAALKDTGKTTRETPDSQPRWLGWSGKQPGGRLCAIGYSEPTFFADKTFDAVVDDVRGQLALVVQTLVSSYYEELSNGSTDLAQQMTVASTDALSKGVIVTHYWHDLEGIGPYHHKHTTYGWGCVYPVDVLKTTLAKTQDKLPEDAQKKIEAVKTRAAQAFDALDAETVRQAAKGPGPATSAAQADGGQE
jgi:hypothetical protein